MPHRKRQTGFTIVELIVTMSILGLMLFLINELFNDTSQAVQTSVQTSKTIATNRSINEQLTQDADAMVGPGLDNDGGYIVIIQQRIPNVPMLDPQNLSEFTVPELRSDQLLFIREAVDLKSMTPATASGYGTNFVGMPGDRAKVWYGHAQRTQPNGQPRTAANTNLGGSAAKLDRIASNWIMGRQAMLFNPTNAATGNTLANVPTGFTHADTGYYGSPVNNAGGYTNPFTYKGLTDITAQEYGPASVPGTLLYQLTDPSLVANHTANYINTTYPDADDRLHVNTSPDPDDTNYASWAIAQGHPVLAQGCSEIIVDFAADLNGNGRIDRVFGGNADTSGPIYWYDALRQGNPVWATIPAGNPVPLVGNVVNQRIFVFRVDDDEPHPGPEGTPAVNSSWPYLIRVRYRLHDTRGRLTGNYAAALRDGLDNDGDGDVDENGEDQISGRWFERIISVPRP